MHLLQKRPQLLLEEAVEVVEVEVEVEVEAEVADN